MEQHNMRELSALTQRLLVLAPVGRDAPLICKMLAESRLACTVCADMEAFCAEMERGGGALMVASEALTEDALPTLRRTLLAQPTWSDVALILLASQGQADALRDALEAQDFCSNLTVLERPLRVATLASVCRLALRERLRQYEERRLLEQLQEANESLEQRVEERTREVRTLAADLTHAEQRERQRISRILHDHLQQMLFGVQMKLEVLNRTMLADGLSDQTKVMFSQQLNSLQDVAGEAVTVCRTLTVDLTPPVLKGEGLEVAFRWLARHMEQAQNLTIDIKAHDPGHVPPETHDLLFQLVRELLFNVAKHAGVDRATLELSKADGRLIVRVADEGAGFDPKKLVNHPERRRSFGLFSARERLRLFGGRLEIDSAPGKGCRITLTAPARSTRTPEEERNVHGGRLETSNLHR